MRSTIWYAPEGIELDLAEPGLGHPDGREILELHYRQGEQAHPEFNRLRPAFLCMRHHQGTNPGLYLKKIKEQWWAYHYDRSSECDPIPVHAPMSDEHKRQVDYWARAAEHAGWSVELERKLNTGTRPDALIHGVVDTGIEVQLSAMTATRAVTRSMKAQNAGVLEVWFTTTNPHPKWAYRVPSVMEQDISWKILPPPRSATANGLRIIGATRCSPEHFARCPDSGGRQCGKRHPRDRPWRGLRVDDVAARVPAGEIVAMRFYRNQRSNDVLLVSPSSRALYEEMTGRNAAVSFSPGAEIGAPTQAAGAVECQNFQPDRATLQCFRCGENPTGPGGILCVLCRLDIEASDLYGQIR